MEYGTVTVDRRAKYYARVAEHIAKDSLSFYLRAEQGRRILAAWQSGYEVAAALSPSWSIVGALRKLSEERCLLRMNS